MDANNSPAKDSGIDFENYLFIVKRKYQIIIDKMTPFVYRRWAAFGLSLITLLIRMYIKKGYAVIAYLLGLFYLNSLMLYLAPIEDPEEMNLQASDFVLPTRESDEYKGF